MGETIKGVMTENSTDTAVRAILVGGPSSLPEISRTQTVSPASEKIKVMHLGGYEHFERRGAGVDLDGAEIPFHWTMRTKAAE